MGHVSLYPSQLDLLPPAFELLGQEGVAQAVEFSAQVAPGAFLVGLAPEEVGQFGAGGGAFQGQIG